MTLKYKALALTGRSFFIVWINMIDERLKEFATPRQWEYIQALEEYKTLPKTAKALGVAHQTISKARKSVTKKAAKAGYSPEHNMVHSVPDGFQVKGVSTLYDEDGKKKIQWVKSAIDPAYFKECIDSIVDGLTITRIKKVKTPKALSDDRMNVYVFGDSHLDMLSWEDETGKNWDSTIAVAHHEAALLDLIDRSPKADTGVLATMGDLLHRDSLKAVTPGSGNVVDVDGRLGNSLEIAISLIRSMIDRMLNKYQIVKYVCVRGNHSETLELALAKMIRIAYENEPRLEVIDNTSRHIPLTFGKNFLMFTHGDKLNDQKKADIAVSKFRKEHGNADFSHVLSGHVHHASQKELSGVLVETFPALPVPDAWHHESGYVTADQAAVVVSYHKLGGISERIVTNPRIFLG